MKSKKLPVSLFVFNLIFLCTGLVRAEPFRDIDWLELLPENDREALVNQAPIQHGNEQVMQRQSALGGNRNTLGDGSGSAWESSSIIAEMDGQQVRIPGFVVPLEYDDEQRVTEFFLVPYFGACIHVPPPPPNQIIFVSRSEGFELSSIYEPYVVEGEMLTAMTHNEMGVSAYSINAVNIVPYSR